MRLLGVQVLSPAPVVLQGFFEKNVSLGAVRAGVSALAEPQKTAFVGRYPSGQRDQTVNLTASPSEVRILLSPPLLCEWLCFVCGRKSSAGKRVRGGNSSAGRASAFQAEGREFEPRFPLQIQ
jgi:hypothetical protein